MRGNGRVFQRGSIWWIAYYDNGREHRESSGSRERKDAVRMLRQRLGEVATGTVQGAASKQKRTRAVMMQDLFDLVEHNHLLNNRTSESNGLCLQRMRKHFGRYSVQACTGLVISHYMAARQWAGRKPSTINKAGEPMLSVARRFRRGLSLLAFGALVIGCGGLAFSQGNSGDALLERLQQNATEFRYEVGKPGGSLTHSTISGPKTFNLAISTETSSTEILGYLFEGLTESSWLTSRMEGNLAERWETSNDGLVWTFFLRQGVKWSDGAPFTADDVLFTFQRIIYNDDIPASARPGLTIRYLDEATQEWQRGQIDVAKIDDHTVRFTLPVPFAPFLRTMGTPIYPKHILEKHVDDGSFTSTWDVGTDPSEIIGTGPFTIARYDVGERIVLRKNPHYWKKDDAGNALPYLDQVVYLVVQDIAAAVLKFQAGETDVLGVTGDQYPVLKPEEATKNFTLHRQGPNFGTTFLAFNQNRGKNPDNDRAFVEPAKLKWFTNPDFRKAVAHSVDKDSIIDNVMNGLGYPQWAAISPAAGPFHNPNVTKYAYDLRRANDLLDSLGWFDLDGDGFREDDEGNTISFTLATNSGNDVREKVCTLLKQDLAKVGIQANTRFMEFNSLVSQLVSTYDWETIVIGFTGGVEPHGGINLWHSSERLHLWYPLQETPATPWEAAINELFVRGSREMDEKKRYAIYHEFQQVASDNLPVIYTALAERITAVRNHYGNVTPTLYGLYDVRYLYVR